MDTKNDKIRENIMLCLLAVSPVLIGYLYNVLMFIPVIGSIWMYAAPFTLLLFWGWVGTVFYARFKSVWKAVLLGNLAGLICFLMFIGVFTAISSADAPSRLLYMLSGLAQMYTLPLSFITAWIAVIKDGVYDMIEVTMPTMLLMQAAGLLLMIAAFTAGCVIARRKKE